MCQPGSLACTSSLLSPLWQPAANSEATGGRKNGGIWKPKRERKHEFFQLAAPQTVAVDEDGRVLMVEGNGGLNSTLVFRSSPFYVDQRTLEHWIHPSTFGLILFASLSNCMQSNWRPSWGSASSGRPTQDTGQGKRSLINYPTQDTGQGWKSLFNYPTQSINYPTQDTGWGWSKNL